MNSTNLIFGAAKCSVTSVTSVAASPTVRSGNTADIYGLQVKNKNKDGCCMDTCIQSKVFLGGKEHRGSPKTKNVKFKVSRAPLNDLVQEWISRVQKNKLLI